MESSQLLYVKILFAKIAENAPGKMLAGVAMTVMEFFFDGALIETAIASLLALVIFDFITAIGACYIPVFQHECSEYKKKHSWDRCPIHKPGEEIKSAKIFRTALKIGIYGTLVSAAHLTETTIGANFIPLNAIDETMLAFLGLTELISIMENSGRMGFQMPHLLLNKLRDAQGAR